MSRRMWKADLARCEVREVEADPYPARDSEGEKVYDNTHFEKRHEAVRKLMSEAISMVTLEGREVTRLKNELLVANERAASAAERCHRVDQYVRDTGGVQ